MLHPEINLSEKADAKLIAMQNAAQVALQSMRFSRDEIPRMKLSLELSLEVDPDNPEDVRREHQERLSIKERKALLAAAELSMEQSGKRHAELQKKLSAIYGRSHSIVRNCARKHLQLPPLTACDVDENHADPFRWLGVDVGKSVPKKTRQQLRAEYERDPNQRPNEHPLSYRDRMQRLNGPRAPRVRLTDEQYVASINRVAMQRAVGAAKRVRV